jgi:hypothetical protein
MRFKTIDFPPEILQAQRDGNLVLFVGAGVSKPRPSGLPDFATLAQKIGEGASPKEKNEPEDQYLGRLCENGVPVHDLATKFVLDPKSKHTELHTLILQLFVPEHPIRIVTTNFDNHFLSSVDALGLKNVKTFCAPALPLGDDFEGIVYLHGSAVESPKNIVLTDSDFGRAYLTYGWASRFLSQMFSAYTVLFVGYSHNDVVMRYLARGLPPKSQHKRFAFSLGTSEATWKVYGIRSLLYEKRRGGNSHYAITESLREWVEDIHRGLSARVERIRSIVEAAPPLEGEDADYLEHWLREIDVTHQFTKIAKLPGYIQWLEQHDFLGNFFKVGVDLTPVDEALIWWIVDVMIPSYPTDVLRLIQRNSQVLHAHFCWRICQLLLYRGKEAAVEAVFYKLILLLLSQPCTNLPRQNYAQLLAECRWPAGRECAVLLFQWITLPQVVLTPSSAFLAAMMEEDGMRNVDFAVDIESSSEHWLSKSWEKFFKPHLTELFDSIEPIITTSLRNAHAILLLSGKADSNYDGLSFCRQAVKNHERFPKLFDTLVDAGRDVLEFMLKNKANEGALLIEKWFRSEVPIFKRLAVYGVAINTRVTANEKVCWVLDQDLLFQFNLKTEVFDLLLASYPSVTKDIRRRLIDRVLQGVQGEQGEKLGEDTKEYEIFNLLVWLTRSDAQCEIARVAFNSIRTKHPDFSERDHPDANFWCSSVTLAGPKINQDEVLEHSPSEFLGRIISASQKAPFGERRCDYASALMTLIAKNSAWGFSFQIELVNQKIKGADIWTQVFNGWREANLDKDAWVKWFDAIDQIQNIDLVIADGVSDVLYTRCERKSGAIPDDLMDRAYKLSQCAWTALQEDIGNGESVEYDDWLMLAINRPGGKLGRFWLEYISLLKRRMGDAWTALPLSIKSDLKAVVAEKSISACYARVILTSHFHYFFYLDPEFARSILLPLFNWNLSCFIAVQSWSGFLGWGRWTKDFLDELLPFYKQTVARITQFPERYQEAFVEHIASIAVFGIADPLKGNWLGYFISGFSQSLRAHFAKTLRETLEGMEPAPAVGLWNRWLCHYWTGRIAAKPVPLEHDEINWMILWPLYLHEKFPDAVALILNLPKFNIRFPINEKEAKMLLPFCKTFGKSVADYLVVILQRTQKLYNAEVVEKIISELEPVDGGSEKLSKIKDELLRFQ